MKTSILRALSEKSFRYLWVGEIFTQIATHFFNFFLILIVFERTHSNTAVSGIVLSFIIPAIIFGSVAGIFVDRWSKKTVLVATNLSRAALLLILIFFLHNLFFIYLISFLVAVLAQFFIPAEAPMVPLTVKPQHLLSANALFGIAIYGSIMVAYILSGPTLLLFGEMQTLLILASMLVVGAGVISFIKMNNAKEKQFKNIGKNVNILKDIRHTLSLISKTREISYSIFLLALSQILILIIATIAPGYAHQILRIDIKEFPLLFVAPAALGMVIGGIIITNFFHSHPKSRVINIGIFLSGIAMLLLPYGSKVASRGFIRAINAYLPHILRIDILHIMTVLAFLLGVANAFVFVSANTIILEQTTDEIRGKIYGFVNTIVGVLALLPIIIVGGLSDLIGVGAVVSGIGIVLLLFGIVRVFLK